MIAYVDSSVLLRLALHQPKRLADWPRVTRAISSALAEVECLRTLDRLRVRGRLSVAQQAAALGQVRALLDQLSIIPLADRILARAGQAFGTPLGTLDALHLASALAFQESEGGELVFATHDSELGLAARLLGFELRGV